MPVAQGATSTPTAAGQSKKGDLAPARAAVAQDKKVHRVALQVNSDDPAVMNLALNNIKNMYDYYAPKGNQLEVKLVTFGPGLTMLREDKSPVKERLASMKQQFQTLTYAACANTKQNMEKSEGKEVPITPIAEMVASGVIELVELQEAGWSYLRP